MLTPGGGSRIYLALRPVDMRKGFDGLTAQVAQMLQEDPFGGQLFLFRSRRGDRLKAVWWDGTGLCNPCSPNLCEAARIGGCRQCRRIVGAGTLDGDVSWKPATRIRRSQPGPRSPRPVGAGWAS